MHKINNSEDKTWEISNDNDDKRNLTYTEKIQEITYRVIAYGNT